MLLCKSLKEPGPRPKAALLFLDCASLISAFSPLRTLITGLGSWASAVEWLRPKRVLLCQESLSWFSLSMEFPYLTFLL